MGGVVVGHFVVLLFPGVPVARFPLTAAAASQESASHGTRLGRSASGGRKSFQRVVGVPLRPSASQRVPRISSKPNEVGFCVPLQTGTQWDAVGRGNRDRRGYGQVLPASHLGIFPKHLRSSSLEARPTASQFESGTRTWCSLAGSAGARGRRAGARPQRVLGVSFRASCCARSRATTANPKTEGLNPKKPPQGGRFRFKGEVTLRVSRAVPNVFRGHSRLSAMPLACYQIRS